nr:DNA alkylation repair protein [Corynebacterium lactis]
MPRIDYASYIEEISFALEREVNAENASAMSRYMRNRFRFCGVKTPERRRATGPTISKLVADSTSLQGDSVVCWDVVKVLWDQDCREFQYVVCDYLAALPPLCGTDVEALRLLLVEKSWWDTVDALASVVGRALGAGTIDRQLVLQWAEDEVLWVRRAAIICQRQLKAGTDPELLSSTILSNVGSNEFFVDKAIGWALREFSKTNPAWVKGFLHSYGNKLSALSIREGAKYLDLRVRTEAQGGV